MSMFNEDFNQYSDESHAHLPSGCMSPEMYWEFEQQIESEELDADIALSMLRGEVSIG